MADYETVMATLIAQLRRGGPWLLGEQFTAADVLWGSSLTWTHQFGLIPSDPAILAYIERFNARPLVARCKAQDAEIAAVQDADREKQLS